jgi:hypothetical protein
MQLVQPAFAARVAGDVQASAVRDQDAMRGMIDVAGVEMFDCERLHARMTTAACDRKWAKANGLTTDYRGKAYQVQPWESLFQCRGCPIGAGRNGRSIDPVDEGRRAISKVCPRCLRLTDRMVRVHGDPDKPLCVSCTNRQYELEKGRNAKGGKPEKLRLRSVTLMVIEDGQSRIETVHGVASASEAIMRLARKATRPLQFLPVPMLPPKTPPEAAAEVRKISSKMRRSTRAAPILLSATLQVHSQIVAELSSPPPPAPPPRPRLPAAHRWLLSSTAFTNPPIILRRTPPFSIPGPPFRPHRAAA